jgi:hypothetical protein
VVPLRGRHGVLHGRRRHHLQLRASLPHGPSVPVGRGRVVSVGLPVSRRRHPVRHRPAEPWRRPCEPDRLPDHRDRRRRPVVGLPDGAVLARSRVLDRREARLDRVSLHGPAAPRRDRADGGRRRKPCRVLLPVVLRRGHAVGDRRCVRARPDRQLQPERSARGRMGDVLRPVGRRGAAPVDVEPLRASSGPGGQADPASPGSPGRRFVDGATGPRHPEVPPRPDRRPDRRRSLDRAVPPRCLPDGGPGPQAGAVGAAGEGAPRGRCGARHGDQPREHLRRRPECGIRIDWGRVRTPPVSRVGLSCHAERRRFRRRRRPALSAAQDVGPPGHRLEPVVPPPVGGDRRTRDDDPQELRLFLRRRSRVHRAAVHARRAEGRPRRCRGLRGSARRPRRPRRAGLPSRAGARERRAHGGPSPPPERGEVQLARAELLRRRHGDRARHADRLPDAVDRERVRVHARRARGDEVRRPAAPRRQDAHPDVPADGVEGRGVALRPDGMPGPAQERLVDLRGDAADEPSRRRERPWHRPEHPGHQRAEGVRGAALAPGARSRSSSSTSTTSRRSTTPSATPRATSSCSRSGSA